MVFYDGNTTFYQNNPTETGGAMSWGHAVSRDLGIWEHLPSPFPKRTGS